MSATTDMARVDAARNNLIRVLEKGRDEFAKYGEDPRPWLRTIQTALMNSKELAQCDPRKLALCALNAASLKLKPNGRDFVIVPFWSNRNNGYEPTLIVQYHGMISLAYRSQMVRRIEAHVVHDGDDFDFLYGTGGYIRHKPAFRTIETKDGKQRTEPIFAWAGAELRDGSYLFTVLDQVDIERRRNSAPGGKGKKKTNTPWESHPLAMMRKSAVRELATFLPQEPEMASVLALESEQEAQLPQSIPLIAHHDDSAFDVPIEAATDGPDNRSKSDRIADELETKTGEWDPTTGEAHPSELDSMPD